MKGIIQFILCGILVAVAILVVNNKMISTIEAEEAGIQWEESERVLTHYSYMKAWRGPISDKAWEFNYGSEVDMEVYQQLKIFLKSEKYKVCREPTIKAMENNQITWKEFGEIWDLKKGIDEDDDEVTFQKAKSDLIKSLT